ncbi:MAG: hypothetical protein BWY65_00068 [Firmicutes bacterium ADurb.Bin373]|nr:hypothetical protein [Bacillota bacterium]OQA11272.1 MAG: hypothetical protein BWY65_00068 [Firmicutes bacterium ADurb.Bin373]
MFSYRTIAKIGAAALAFIALSKVSRHCKGKSSAECADKVAGRVKGIIRRRKTIDMDLTGDVI